MFRRLGDEMIELNEVLECPYKITREYIPTALGRLLGLKTLRKSWVSVGGFGWFELPHFDAIPHQMKVDLRRSLEKFKYQVENVYDPILKTVAGGEDDLKK